VETARISNTGEVTEDRPHRRARLFVNTVNAEDGHELLPPSPSNTPEFVDEHTVILSCDIDEKQRALYRSSAKKPPPGPASKLSSE
jgi:hypothetical protein